MGTKEQYLVAQQSRTLRLLVEAHREATEYMRCCEPGEKKEAAIAICNDIEKLHERLNTL
jgi:hypothetical protein